MSLACPTCRVDLVMSERHGIEIDYCPKCRGVWLDRGELDKIIERADGGRPMPAPSVAAMPQNSGLFGAPSSSARPVPPPQTVHGGYPARADGRRWDDDDDDHYKHGRKKQKSWLSEIFD